MNRRNSILILLAVVLLWWGAGCAKQTPSKPEPTTKSIAEVKPAAQPVKSTKQATPKPVAKPKPELAPIPESELEPVPEIMFSLRGPEAGRLGIDRPLLVNVRIESSVDKQAALTLAPAQGRWRDAVSVELASAGAPEKILIRAQQADGADDATSATLGTGEAAEGMWLFPSAKIAQLGPGDYHVQIKLVIADGAGWRGTALSETAGIALVAAESSPTAEQQVRHALALAEEAMLAKDWPKAAQVLDERLASDPDNLELLKSRAIVCFEGGNIPAANVCVNRAWARVMREKWSHPPGDLYALSQAVMAAMLKSDANASKEPLPSWSMPPAAVLEPIREVGPMPRTK